MLEGLLRWAGGSPGHYWAIAAVAGAALATLAIRPGRTRPWMFLTALAVCLLACRWPGIVHNVELGVDESQMIAGALTLKSNPVFWKYVDGTTHGPLNQYPLTVLGWLGFPLNYVTTRMFALAMVWVALAGIYWLLRESFDEQLARIAILPPAAFFSLNVFWDFIHYTTEHVPIALLSVGAAWIWRAAQRGGLWPAFLGTAALGAVPWAKLQGAPVALWLALSGGVLLAWRTRQRRQKLLPVMSCWLAGGLLATAGFALLLTIWGLWPQWRISYLGVIPYQMAIGGSAGESIAQLPDFIRSTPQATALFLPLALLIFVMFGRAIFQPGRHAVLLCYVIGAAVASLYVYAAPGRAFFHYQLFLVVPFAVLAACLLGVVLEQRSAQNDGSPDWIRPAVLGIFLLLTLLPQIHGRTHHHPFLPYRPDSRQPEQAAIRSLILQHASPGDPMTVWGYVPRLYVETGLKQATRIAHTEYQIRSGSLQSFYRDRFLRDFKRRTPRVFVDAVGPGHFAFTERSKHGFESWPELAAIIDEQFEFVGEAQSCRVYVYRGPPLQPW